VVRLKIYLAPDERTEQFCRDVNARIRGITDSAIVFSETSLMIPHITLLMGELAPTQTFDALTKAVEALVRGVAPLMLRLSHPYVEPLQGRYVECAIQENPALNELRERMSKALLDTYLSERVARPFVPHLTLAHIDARQDQVRAHLRQVGAIPQTNCARVEISHVGPRGTSVDRLFAIDLGRVDPSLDSSRGGSPVPDCGSRAVSDNYYESRLTRGLSVGPFL
jgi:2'-5' RNA ligase